VTASQSADGPSYEQARDELTELVKRLESGGLTLEQSLQVWERGEALAALCEEWLEGARARLAGAAASREPGKASAGKASADKASAGKGSADKDGAGRSSAGRSAGGAEGAEAAAPF
jgi:exodeoxyribonuclease VII small subunit